MTLTHTLAAIIALIISGLALASAFAASQQQHQQRIAAFPGPKPVTVTVTVTDAAPIFTASRRTIVSMSATSGDAESASEEKTSDEDKNSSGNSNGNNNEIYLWDEIDAIFDCVDTNNDGTISPSELRAHLVEKMGYSTQYTDDLFASIDTDSNGSISREELGVAFYDFEALNMYMTFGIGGAELTQKFETRQRQRKRKRDLDREREHEHEHQAATTPETVVARDKLLLDDLANLVFDMIDTDQSGQITKEELQAHFDTVTEKLDSCTDGKDDSDAQSQSQQDSQSQQQPMPNAYVQTMFATLDADNDGNICREEIRSAFEKYDFKLLARTFGLKVYR